jgi:hypothetical protein
MATVLAHVTVVTAHACHFCEDARQAMAELGQFYPFTVEELAAHSPAGEALVLEYGAGLYPLVLVDGAFFSAGRLPRRKLARLFCGLASQRVPAAAGAR